jgi:hypothetical protein
LPCFEQELPALVHFVCEHILVTPLGINHFKHEGWKLQQQRIQPRQGQHPQAHFRDTLAEEGRKVFEMYRNNLEELFLSCCEVTRHGTVLKDTTLIVFNKPEAIPEVQPNPSFSRNDIQFMIDSALERQAKSTDELLRRLIEERDGKKLDATIVNLSSSTCTVNFTQTNLHTSDPSAGGTSMPNPSVQPVNHFHSWTTIEGSAPTFRMLQQATVSMFG